MARRRLGLRLPEPLREALAGAAARLHAPATRLLEGAVMELAVLVEPDGAALVLDVPERGPGVFYADPQPPADLLIRALEEEFGADVPTHAFFPAPPHLVEWVRANQPWWRR